MIAVTNDITDLVLSWYGRAFTQKLQQGKAASLFQIRVGNAARRM
jgi:hypothetical protein